MGVRKSETAFVKTEIGYRKLEVTGPQYRLTIGDSESLMVKTNTPVSIPPSPIRSTESRCYARNRHWETQSRRWETHAWVAPPAIIDMNCEITGVGTVLHTRPPGFVRFLQSAVYGCSVTTSICFAVGCATAPRQGSLIQTRLHAVLARIRRVVYQRAARVRALVPR